MKSNRCVACAIAWPLNTEDCPVCGEETTTSYAQPERTPEDVHAIMLQRAKPSPAHLNRVDRYLAMGFSEVDAEVMACAKDYHGCPVYHGDIQRCLEAGATHDQMVQIHA